MVGGARPGVAKQPSGSAHENVVLTLVERRGSARGFHVDRPSIADIIPVELGKVADVPPPEPPPGPLSFHEDHGAKADQSQTRTGRTTKP
jgi:hypothetical protein